MKTEWEIGTDLRFFNNDLTFSFTYYNNKIEDILLNVSLSPSSGFSTQYGNFGAMKNKGYEIDLGWNAIQKQDLNLNTTLNWSRNVNEVTDFMEHLLLICLLVHQFNQLLLLVLLLVLYLELDLEQS